MPSSAPKSVSILGSTGSIGAQALEVVRRHRGRFRVSGLAARRRMAQLAAQIEEFRPLRVGVPGPEERAELLSRLPPPHPEVLLGEAGLEELAGLAEAEITLVATVGSVGLRPSLAALKRGGRLALANKEALVMAGALMTAEARRSGAEILPIDSEHSAILQSLTGHHERDVRRILLTASGGPFRDATPEAMAAATPSQALAHPTWEMGAKITIDSATLMNKGLEVIEAHHLFALDFERIEVVIHPQSIIHSMVEFVDGSVLAQLGLPDMRVPIQYALSYPERWPGGEEFLDLARLGTLTFQRPDAAKFPCLELAYQVGRAGGSLPTVFSVAGEEANLAFREGRLDFLGIAELIRRLLERHSPLADPGLDEILAVEAETRRRAAELLAHA